MRDDHPIQTALLAAALALVAGVAGCEGPRAWAGSGDDSSANAAAPSEVKSESAAGGGESEASSGERESATETADDSPGQTGNEPERTLAERAMDPSVPLPDRAREVFEAIEFDPIPKDITENSHYVVSNEKGHHLYRPHIRDHGGILMGVGTDQNYLMAGWSESPILLMMDFDEQVRNVHHLYEVVFERIDGPEAFIEQWDDDNVDEIRSWIEKDYSDDEERAEELLETLDLAHDSIFYRLRTTAERYREAEIPTFVTDENQYEFLRGLFERDRVVPIRGDLTGDTAMQEIADALETLDLTLGLLYVSNAEQYFEYSPAYRRNIAVLPFSEDSLVLRTRPMEALGTPEGDKYHYNIQGGRNFARWMAYNDVEDAKQLITWYWTKSEDTKGLSFIRKEPGVSRRPPEVADIGDGYDVDLIEEPEDETSEDEKSEDDP